MIQKLPDEIYKRLKENPEQADIVFGENPFSDMVLGIKEAIYSVQMPLPIRAKMLCDILHLAPNMDLIVGLKEIASVAKAWPDDNLCGISIMDAWDKQLNQCLILRERETSTILALALKTVEESSQENPIFSRGVCRSILANAASFHTYAEEKFPTAMQRLQKISPNHSIARMAHMHELERSPRV